MPGALTPVPPRGEQAPASVTEAGVQAHLRAQPGGRAAAWSEARDFAAQLAATAAQMALAIDDGHTGDPPPGHVQELYLWAQRQLYVLGQLARLPATPNRPAAPRARDENRDENRAAAAEPAEPDPAESERAESQDVESEAVEPVLATVTAPPNPAPAGAQVLAGTTAEPPASEPCPPGLEASPEDAGARGESRDEVPVAPPASAVLAPVVPLHRSGQAVDGGETGGQTALRLAAGPGDRPDREPAGVRPAARPHDDRPCDETAEAGDEIQGPDTAPAVKPVVEPGADVDADVGGEPVSEVVLARLDHRVYLVVADGRRVGWIEQHQDGQDGQVQRWRVRDVGGRAVAVTDDLELRAAQRVAAAALLGAAAAGARTGIEPVTDHRDRVLDLAPESLARWELWRGRVAGRTDVMVRYRCIGWLQQDSGGRTVACTPDGPVPGSASRDRTAAVLALFAALWAPVPLPDLPPQARAARRVKARPRREKPLCPYTPGQLAAAADKPPARDGGGYRILVRDRWDDRHDELGFVLKNPGRGSRHPWTAYTTDGRQTAVGATRTQAIDRLLAVPGPLFGDPADTLLHDLDDFDNLDEVAEPTGGLTPPAAPARVTESVTETAPEPRAELAAGAGRAAAREVDLADRLGPGWALRQAGDPADRAWLVLHEGQVKGKVRRYRRKNGAWSRGWEAFYRNGDGTGWTPLDAVTTASLTEHSSFLWSSRDLAAWGIATRPRHSTPRPAWATRRA
ncbi:hypothetical protein ACIBF1_44365 [Spirillospora sp. NPDC050679]